MKSKNRLKNRIALIIGISRYVSCATWFNDKKVQLKEIFSGFPSISRDSFEKPLIYISQPPRCGGTLLRNLFDGHSHCVVYPYELSWEKNGYHFSGNISNDLRTFRLLKDGWLSHAINNGIDSRIPFKFSMKGFRQMFLAQDEQSSRRVLDSYFQSFYSMWQNCTFNVSPKFNVAFCPWNQVSVSSVVNFYDIYPDGYRIHIIRDPRAWWLSEKRYTHYENKDIQEYTENRWIESTKSAELLQNKFPGKYLLINYENLVGETKQSLEILCSTMGLRYEDTLSNPTFNNVARFSNSSSGSEAKHISTDSIEMWRQGLSEQEISYLEEVAVPLYNSILAKCLNK